MAHKRIETLFLWKKHFACFLAPIRPVVIAVIMFAAIWHGYGAATYYVWTNSPNEGTPYNDWSNAAHAIQTAVNVATNGDIVVVTNGLYNTGGLVTPGYALTNRVCITNIITLRSINGPAYTTIKGVPASGGEFGTGAVRCVYMNTNAFLIGFALSGGYTMSNGNAYADRGGGGIYGDSGAVISNCLIISNFAYGRGGGIIAPNGQITVNNCVLTGNRATNDFGGGLYVGGTMAMNNCIISNNKASAGGGVFIQLNTVLKNCLLIKNISANEGAGAYLFWGGRLTNCTIAGNSGGSSGGVHFYVDATHATGQVNNCVIWGNTSGNSYSNFYNGGGIVNYTCSGPVQSGTGNIGSDPQFVEASHDNYHLRMSSPCVNTGSNQDWMTNAVDLDGNARILNNIVDMGAYETLLWQGTIYKAR